MVAISPAGRAVKNAAPVNAQMKLTNNGWNHLAEAALDVYGGQAVSIMEVNRPILHVRSLLRKGLVIEAYDELGQILETLAKEQEKQRG